MVSKRWWRRRFDASIEHTDERKNIQRQKTTQTLILMNNNDNKNNPFFPSLSFQTLTQCDPSLLVNKPNLYLLFSPAAARQKGVTFRPPDLPALIVHSGILKGKKKQQRKYQEKKILKSSEEVRREMRNSPCYLGRCLFLPEQASNHAHRSARTLLLLLVATA